MARCPKCLEYMTHLIRSSDNARLSAPMSAEGTWEYEIEIEDWGDCTYTCPECYQVLGYSEVDALEVLADEVGCSDDDPKKER